MAVTFVASYGPGALSTTATQTASVTVAAGDLLVLWGATGLGTWAPGTPSGGGLTWTKQAEPNTTLSGSSAEVVVWTAVSASAQTFTLTWTASGASSAHTWTWQALRWSGAQIGNVSSILNGGSAPSLAITTTGTSSTVVMVVDDWNAVSGTSRTYNTATAGAFTETYYGTSATFLTAYAGYYASPGTAGAKTVGLTAPTGQQPAMIAVELTPAASAFSGSLALSGSGGLAGSGAPAIAGSIGLSGSGGLTLSGVAGFVSFSGSVSLAGAGGLALSGTASFPAAPGGIFRAPIYQRRYPLIPPLTVLMNYSVALLRIQGQWVEAEFPTEEQINASEYYFPGGYEIPVDAATAAVLTAAGYTVS